MYHAPTLAPQTQFIAAIGNPASSSGTNANEWCVHGSSLPPSCPLPQFSLRLNTISATTFTSRPLLRGIWRIDPGPRGVRLGNYRQLQARPPQRCYASATSSTCAGCWRHIALGLDLRQGQAAAARSTSPFACDSPLRFRVIGGWRSTASSWNRHPLHCNQVSTLSQVTGM